MLSARTHWTLNDEYITITYTPQLDLAGGINLPLGDFTIQIPIDYALLRFDSLRHRPLSPTAQELVAALHLRRLSGPFATKTDHLWWILRASRDIRTE